MIALRRAALSSRRSSALSMPLSQIGMLGCDLKNKGFLLQQEREIIPLIIGASAVVGGLIGGASAATRSSNTKTIVLGALGGAATGAGCALLPGMGAAGALGTATESAAICVFTRCVVTETVVAASVGAFSGGASAVIAKDTYKK
ncbi:unnamed protein product [Polarella glacialis]|uniref:Uncharacterized protein n=1 Tax=Polarella glacialis TaxID=89957 RepID=A0A813D1Q3_POLGL|nr:unnamed protein product [Polarella glacialis]